MPSVSICLPAELGPAEVGRWRELQRGDPRLASPFLAPEFAVALGRHRRDVRVAVLQDGPRVVGFLPFQRGPFGVGRGLGYGLANWQGLVVDDGVELGPGELLAGCGLNVLEFDHLLAHQAGPVGARRAVEAPAPFVDLTWSWDQWVKAKRAKGSTVRTVQRKQRKLEREVGEVVFELDVKRHAALELLMRWKSDQYRRTGRFDRFAKPWLRDLFEELTMLATPEFSGMLSVLSAGGQPVAMQQTLCANGVVAGWFTAYDLRFAAYSPGLGCILELVRGAGELGLRELDMAEGEAGYKETLKDGERTAARGAAERPSPVAALRRLQQAPQRQVLDFVLTRPRLRRLAREALNDVGRARATLTRVSGGGATP